MISSCLSDPSLSKRADRSIFQAALDHLDRGVCLFDAEQRVIAFNPSFAQLLGVSDHCMMVGAKLADLLTDRIEAGDFGPISARYATDCQALADKYWQLIGSSRDRQRCDGRWLRETIEALPDGGRMVTIADLTETKQAEMALLEQASRLQGVLDTMMDAVIVADAWGRLETMNRPAEVMFGYVAGELVGRNISILMADPFRHEHDGYLERYRQSGVRRIIGRGGREVMGRRKDGILLPLELSVSEMTQGDVDLFGDDDPADKDFRETRFIAVLRDISERKKTESILLQAKSQAELANRAKSDFLANMSHELRTPLNAILGFADIIHNKMFGDVPLDEYTGFAGEIQRSGQHLLTLIDGLLDMARIEAGQYELLEQQANLLDIVRDCALLLAGKAEAGGVRVIDRLGAQEVMIHCDHRALRQAILNLLSNAIKFTDPGGQVTLSWHFEESSDVSLVIEDTGVGIPADALDKVFEPFLQLDMSNSRQHEGAGLGLTITRNLVELHGGKVRLISEVGRGTSAIMTLPAQRVLSLEALPG